MARWIQVAISVAVIIGPAGGCGQKQSLDLAATRAARSNVRAADYIGPEACGECHGERYRQWSSNLHRAMNRMAGDAGAIVGDFSGVELRYGGQLVHFFRDGAGVAVMELGPATSRRRFRVTRTIGRRYIQEYVGVEIGVPGAPEVRLPYGYWRREKRWFHQQYFDSWFEREYDDAGALTVAPDHVDPTPWVTRCAWCHNTIPFEVRLGRAHGDDPRGHGPEVLFTLAGAPAPAGNAMPLSSVVTVGISCESCHFGGREHAAGGRIRFGPIAPGLTPVPGAPRFAADRNDASTINRICAQCHAAPSLLWPSGAAMRNSREALDMASGACAGAIKCTDCHDPHPRGRSAGAPDRPEHNAACARCHGDIAQSEGEHSRHAPGQTSCLDCHMPRVVQGFSGDLRSHRIGSPSPAQLLAGREPDACGLCHLEMSTRDLVEALAAWGLRSKTAGEGDVDQPIGERWLESDAPIVRVTAAAAYGRHRIAAAAPALVAILDDPIAYYRMRVVFALEAVLGRELTASEYDPSAAPATRRRQAGELASRPPSGATR